MNPNVRLSVLKGLRFVVVVGLVLGSAATLSHAEHTPIPLISGVDVRVPEKKVVSHAFSSAAKATVLVFMSAQCPCSSSHEPDLVSLAKEYESKGFRFLGVHSNFDENESMTFTHFKDFGFPILQDDRARHADLFGALKTPHAFIVLTNGEIVYSGGVDDCRVGGNPKDRYLKTALDQVVAGKKVDPKEVRTMGCRIARP